MSNATLTVRLNEERPHDLSVSPAFSTSDPFVVELENRGQAAHVHLHVDDELARVVSLSGGNHYVDGGQTRSVRVSVTPASEPVTGKLKVVSGYGSETAYVDVTVEPGSSEKAPVDVDDSLSKPKHREPDPSVAERLADVVETLDPDTLPLVGLVVVALLLAVGVASVFESFVVTLGAGVVVGAVLVAAVLALR